MLSNNGMLLKGVLIPKLLNSPLASWFFINLDLLLPHMIYFDDNVIFLLLAFESLGFMPFVVFVHFKQYDNIVLYSRI